MKFRTDIQILRGISVLLVVFFHLGFSSFASGFLGVDIFFVISGFLMAVLYDHRDKSSFFKRRALRLLPAYYVTIIGTLIFSFLFTTRNESSQVVEQALWASFYASNIGFWTQESYFSSGNFNPLLHLWSLGVELQFYLLVPLLAFFIRKLKWSLILFIVMSVAMCFLAITVSPKTSFFLTPFRIWEFLAGYAVALYATQDGNVKYQKQRWLGAAGLFLIALIPIFPVEGNSFSPINGHPGLTAFLLTLSTCGVLAFGIPTFLEQNRISSALVTLGKYSYSIYLAHFPIVVIYNSKPFQGTTYGYDSLIDLFWVIVLVGIFSYFLHNWIERRKFASFVQRKWLPLTALASSVVVIVALSLHFAQGHVIPRPQEMIFAASNDKSQFRCGKLFRAINPTAPVCELTGLSKGEASGAFMLAGNSHADSIKESFRTAAKKYQYQLFFFVSNSNLNKGATSPDFVVQQAKENNISHIFVHQSAMAFDIDIMSRLLARAEEARINVVYVEPVPIWPHKVPEAMYFGSLGKEFPLPTKSIDDYYSEFSSVFDGLDKLERLFDLERIKIVSTLCNPECQYKDSEGRPLYYDRHHLTETGSNFVYPVIEKSLHAYATSKSASNLN